MLDDDLVLGAVVKFAWVPDRALLADIKPRHIGRVVSFGYGEDHTNVMGTLDKVDGFELIISGDPYDWTSVVDFKIWRKVIDNG